MSLSARETFRSWSLRADLASAKILVWTLFSFHPDAELSPDSHLYFADRYQRLAGTIFGFLFATGLIGGMLFPFGIGHISQSFGVRTAMVLPLAGAAAIATLAALIERRMRSA